MFTDVREYKSLLSLSFLIGTLAPRMKVYMFCSVKRGLCGVFCVEAFTLLKKVSGFPSPAGMSLTKLSLDGNN